MTKKLLEDIINPICLHCAALTYACRGLTIKDWVKAKGCEAWEFTYCTPPVDDKLDLYDYLVGEDSPYGPTKPIKVKTPDEDFLDLAEEVTKL